MRTLALLVGILGHAVLIAGDKPDYSGSWRPESGNSSDASVQITQTDSEIRLLEKDTGQEIACNTMGKECEVKLEGKPAKVSFYYNGAMLIEWRMEGRDGKRATKIRRKLSEDGRKMSVEVMPIEPPGTPRETIFVKVEPAGSTNAQRQ